MEQTLQALRTFFDTGKTRDLELRIRMLRALRAAIAARESELQEALFADLGKSSFEAYETEIAMVYREIDCAVKNLRQWAAPRRVPAPFFLRPASGHIYTEPLGVVLILSPWNYPFQLTLCPLVAAVAAGNCAAVKPSRYAMRTSVFIQDILSSVFPPEYVSVFQGGSEMNQALLACRFDHIFFTGSSAVGRVVMRAAAEHLTPVTLELGGKSPCIVDETCDLKTAARRIAWGKALNAGQTCVAPDYVLVHHTVKDRLVRELARSFSAFYGSDPLSNSEYPKIINEKHFNRLLGLMEGGHVLSGGRAERAKHKIEPTILDGVSLESPIMREEIFGPLLPILTYRTLNEAAGVIRSFDKPLALYLFTSERDTQAFFMNTVSFGGGCVGDTVMHLACDALPFGGVGGSGMGRYHGQAGFRTFSNEKSVLRNPSTPDIKLRYPPYRDKLTLLRKLMR